MYLQTIDLTSHLEVIHVLILQGASWGRCSRQREFRCPCMMTRVFSLKTHRELRLVYSGQMAAP